MRQVDIKKEPIDEVAKMLARQFGKTRTQKANWTRWRDAAKKLIKISEQLNENCKILREQREKQ